MREWEEQKLRRLEGERIGRAEIEKIRR